MNESDITLCGHGGGNPRTIRMDKYLSQRYKQTAPNGKHKGVICVRRFKKMDDLHRIQFHDTYKTILGRNIYSQDLRKYCYKPYSNGKYYSDCSSSVCLTLAKIGFKIDALNTEGIYYSDLFENVPVKISNGHILNPEILKVADFLEFVGNDPDRPQQIGHVEAVYEIFGSSPDPKPSEDVRKYQKFLNDYYSRILDTAGVGRLVVDGEYGEITRAASVAIWKFMANKYYDASLTIGNSNFLTACKAVAAKMTDEEVDKHATLRKIQSGILAGRGFNSLTAFRKGKGVSSPADTWYALFN